MGGSKRKKWIDLVEMASIGKPYESATAIDLEARFWLFWHREVIKNLVFGRG